MIALYNQLRRSIWLSWLLDNPLLVREIRRRMRGKLFSWSLIGYLAALGGVSCVIMFSIYPAGFREVSMREMIQSVQNIGKTIYRGMMFVEGFIALFIAPMLTAGLATQEKEKDTFDFLRVTTLSARTFVIGCLLTTASFLILVFSCTLPVLGLTFIFGGVSMSEILSFNLLIFLAAMAISAWGVFNSTSYQRSRSVQGSLVVVMFLLFYFGARIYGFATGRSLNPFQSALAGGWLQFAAKYAPFFLLVFFFSVAAARRLYEPDNRLFNYKQYTLFFGLVMGSIGGTIAWRMSAHSYAPLNPAQLNAYLNAYFWVGLVLTFFSILVFGVGRIEKGDEVWQIRHAFLIFRWLHEQYLFYALYLAAWLLPLLSMSAAWDSDPFPGRFLPVIPVILATFVLAVAIARCVNLLPGNRNRLTILTFLAYLVVWGLAAIAGAFLMQIKNLELLGELMLAASPVSVVVSSWEDSLNSTGALCIGVQLGLAALFTVPTLMPIWRSRLRVSYEWWSAHGTSAPEITRAEST
jgi:hypothetical protein